MATSSHSSHPTFSYTDNIAATGTDFLLLVGRVFLGWLFLTSGYGKLGGIPGTTAYSPVWACLRRSFGLGLQASPKSFSARL